MKTVLFKGERKAKKTHECMDCFRSICKGEFYYTCVYLMKDGIDHYVLQYKSCCKRFH